MAEKYGTVPKKFTRAWWEYFWMYYKWHVIITAFIVIALATTIYQNITAPKYDLTVTYAGAGGFSEEISSKITQTLSPLCEDVDENGEKSVDFVQLNIAEGLDPDFAMAMKTKLDIYISEEDVFLYIMDDYTVSAYIGETQDECCFIPLSDWVKINEDAKTYNAHGKAYGIELTECEMFKEIADETGLDFSGSYLFVRYYPRKDQVKDQLAGHNAAMKLAKSIVTIQ